MAAGDAQRVWFPEMLQILAAEWSPQTTWSQLAELCQRMTALRTDLRATRGIRPPRYHCPECGDVSTAELPPVSVRSAMFRLVSLGLITREVFEGLDRDWSRFRRVNRLDAYGQAAAVRGASDASSRPRRKEARAPGGGGHGE